MIKQRKLKPQLQCKQNIFVFLWLYLFPPLTIIPYTSFIFNQLEGNNKTGETKATAFFDYDKNASKNICTFL